MPPKELQLPPTPYPDSHSSIIRKTGNQYWFGNPEPKTIPIILLGSACFVVLILVAMLLEPKPPGEPKRSIILLTGQALKSFNEL